jgi:DNA-binding beta-propeller fold protein YncE
LLLLAGIAGCGSTPQTVEQPKAVSFWPPSPDEPRIQYLTSFEKSSDVEPPKTNLDRIIAGNDPQEVLPISKPYGVKMWQGKIYVCDLKQHAVIILDLRSHVTRVMGVTGNLHLDTPTDIAIAPDGTKYVSDMARGAVVVFNASDQQIAIFTHPNFKPVGVAVYNDELAVADFQAQHVEIFDRNTGQSRRILGSPGMDDGQFVRPLSLTYDPQGNLYVCDVFKCRVQKFDREGKLIKAFGSINATAGNFVRPKHIAVDADDVLYVVDAAFQNVQLFDASGRTLTFFGAAGLHPGAMQLPAGICVTDDPANLEFFRQFAHPAFEVQRVILVTNQFGRSKVAIYGLGKLKAGKTISDIASSRNALPTGLDTGKGTTRPTTLQALPPDDAAPHAVPQPAKP